MKGPATAPGTVPVGPLLSMYDPIYIGVDEFGAPVYTKIIYRNLLAAGEPGGGKSGLLNIFAAHAALSVKTRLVLFDGKQVELGMWDDLADEFVGPDLDHAIITLRRLQRGDGQPLLLARARTAAAKSSRSTTSASSPRSSTRSPCTPPCWAPRLSSANSCPCSGTWSPAAAPPPCRSSPPPSAPRWTSSPKPSGTCSATAPRSAAPPPAAATSSSATAGQRPDSTPPTSAPTNPGVAYLITEGGVPQRDQRRLPDRRATSSPWPTTPPGPAAPPPPWRGHHPGGHPRRLTPKEGKPLMSYSTQPSVRADLHHRARATWPPTWTTTRPSRCPPWAPASACTPPTPRTADAARSPTSPPSSAPPSPTTPADGGHLTATRMFGPIGYTVISIPATVMAAHHARDSYYHCITPDMP